MGKPKPLIRNRKSTQEIVSLWGDIPVADADHDLRVFIRPEDLAGAKRKEPESCVFARACRRAFGSRRVMFLRSIAYVELADNSGKHRVERFVLGPGMRDLIESFDRGAGIIPEAGFLLKAPSKCRTMEYNRCKQRRRTQRLRSRERTQKKREGTYVRRGQQGVGANKSTPIISDVRNGSGAVHFTRAV